MWKQRRRFGRALAALGAAMLLAAFACSSGPAAPDGEDAGGAADTGGGRPAGASATARVVGARTCPATPTGLVTFSVPSGVFEDTVTVELSTAEPGAEIRYTTNRTAPTATSARYADPLRFTTTTNLRAQAFVADGPIGAPADALYLATSIDATHDVPVMVLDSYGVALPSPMNAPARLLSGLIDAMTAFLRRDARRPANREFVDTALLLYEPDGGTAALSSTPAVANATAYRIRGQSSTSFAKRPYRLELRDGFGDDRDCPMIGMPAESDWVLHPPFADKALIRNAFVYSLGREMGMAAPRAAFVELYVNSAGRPLEAGDYQGVYLLVETIKNQRDRLNLRQLDESDTRLPAITGGYIFKFEWLVTDIEQRLACPGGEANCWDWLEVSDPSPWNQPQREYLARHLREFVSALHSSAPADPTTGYPAYIDVPSFVDQVIVHELTRNLDAYVRSQFFYKDRGTRIFAGPLWDYDLVAGVGTSRRFANLATAGWQYESNASRIADTAEWFPVLLAEPAFRAALVARWRELRTGLLSDAAVRARIRSLTAGLEAAATRNAERWPNLQVRRISYFETPTAATWREQVHAMEAWLLERAAWLDTEWQESDGHSSRAAHQRPSGHA